MQTTTIQKSRSTIKEIRNKPYSSHSITSKKDVSKKEKKQTVPKKSDRKKEEIENLQKMFVSSLDPYDVPLKWWETQYVKYALNYPPVKRRLQKLMGTPIVRLTDRKYMLKLGFNIMKDHEEQQKIRIEGRKLAPPSIISQLMKVSYKALSESLKQQDYNKLRLRA